MAAKQKNLFTPVRLLKFAGIGAGCGILSAIAVLLLMAVAMTVQDIPHVMVEPIAISAAAIGGLIGGLVASKLLGEKGLIAGLCSGGIVSAVIILLSLASGGFGLGFTAGLKLITVLLAAAVGGVLGVNTKRKRKIR